MTDPAKLELLRKALHSLGSPVQAIASNLAVARKIAEIARHDADKAHETYLANRLRDVMDRLDATEAEFGRYRERAAAMRGVIDGLEAFPSPEPATSFPRPWEGRHEPDPLAEAVERGATLLDEKAPGWAAKVDVGRLAMHDLDDRSVLPLVFGHYSRGCDALGLSETGGVGRGRGSLTASSP